MPSLKIEDVRFVKELYPRLKADEAAIERYRDAIDQLPPIVVARDGILVDGYHRWQAHEREGRSEIAAENLGNLSDSEIFTESIKRNASHGHQLSRRDKEHLAGKLWQAVVHLPVMERYDYIAKTLAVSNAKARDWTKDARKAEQEQLRADVIDAWLDCSGSNRDIAERFGVTHPTVTDWTGNYCQNWQNLPPESRQHFDVWQFQSAAGDSSYFGKMPPQVVENLLWFYTEPGQIVFDPFAGGGTTIDVAKAMGRRVWSSDRKPSSPMLPIHQHDITTGWPDDAPAKVDFVLLDPPYWQQAAGKYSGDPDDMGNMSLADFGDAWRKTIKVCAEHLKEGGRLAFIISPTQMETGAVIDHASIMAGDCIMAGLEQERRIIVPYNTQQATGQQVTWARDNKRMLKLYRDLVVFHQ